MKKILMMFAMVMMAIPTMLADNPASYPGGEEAMNAFIKENLVYPKVSADNGIEGVVSLTVTVKPDGSIGSIKIDRMVDPDLEQEAIRIVKMMPKWNPAVVDGVPANSTAKVKVTFEL